MLVMSAVALIVSCVLVVALYNEKNRLDVLYDQEIQHNFDNSYQAQRITFCYDNDIHPCSMDEIMAWNKAHPDNKLPLVAPSLPGHRP